MALALLGQEVALRYHELLLVGVARELYDLHAVEERAGYGVRRVGRSDEEDAGEVDGDLHIVVAELAVLLAVQGLEQRARGVAPVVAPELIYLVEHHDGVHAPGLDEAVHEPAGHGAYIGLAVAAYLRLVVDAAEGDVGELAVHRAGYAHGDARLAGPGRADEAEHGALYIRRELAHGEELYDALLDLLEAVVVLVEHFARLLYVERLLSILVPGKLEAGVEVAAYDARLGAAEALAAQAGDLLEELLLHVLGKAEGPYLVAVFVELLGPVVLAELALYHLELLAR